MKSLAFLLALLTSLLAGAGASIHAQATSDGFGGDILKWHERLNAITLRGALRCGVRTADLPGFSVRQPDGTYAGFDADFCRAVAAAIFGGANRVQFVPVPPGERLAAVRDGFVDLFVGGVTHTLSRDASLGDGGEGIDFAPVIFYDGQSFVVSAGITTDPDADPAAVLNGTTVCVPENTTSETNLRDFAVDHDITIIAFTRESPGSSGDLFTDFEQGRCDAISTDGAVLISRRAGFIRPNTLLRTAISKEPLAPVVAKGEDQARFEAVVRWVVFATFAAEELDIHSGNVGVVPRTGEGRRLLGYTPGLGGKLGLANDWARQVIGLVGNYREIYERNLPGLPRGKHNVLPSAGGLLFSPPFQ